MRRASTSIIRLCLAATAGVFLLLGRLAPGARGSAETDQAEIFAGCKVLRIQIEIPRQGVNALRGTSWGNGQARPKVKGTVREGGRVYTNVLIHLKGSAGSFRPVDDNPGFTLNFSKFAPGQTFHGMKKISLNNSVQDPSYITDKLCRELFAASGVPAPRAGHAKVSFNGRDLGLRVMIEGYTKQFLKRNFKNIKGNLFDGGFVQEITEPLAVNSGENPRDRSGLDRLIAASQEPNQAKRWTRLGQTLDVERFLSYMAMDVIVCDWDGYPMNRNNYRVFHDLDANRMVFFPHGMDQMFGVERTTPELEIIPRNLEGMVASALIDTQEGRKRYLQRVAELYTNVFKVDDVLKRVTQIAAAIRPVIAESDPQAANYHDEQVAYLKNRVAQRGESLKRQLGMLTMAQSFNSSGKMRLTGWKPQVQTGSPSFRQQRGPNGPLIIAINTADNSAIASWRATAALDPGKYKFEGKLRTIDVKPAGGQANAGGSLRISGGAVANGLSGSGDWRSFSYPFEVTETGTEINFVCEIRNATGEVWFDVPSLQVIKGE
jgi:spore coat protein CotH